MRGMNTVCTQDLKIETLAESLTARLRQPLPGVAAQGEMAPPSRQHFPPAESTPRQSAVLVLLYPCDGAIYTVFTLRAAALNHHGGEVSFPGGAKEPQDHNLQEAARREAHEELGILQESIHIIGALTPLYIPPSDNLVYPYVGWLNQTPAFRPEPEEVERVLSFPLRQLRRPEMRQRKLWLYKGEFVEIPCYEVEGLCIWGATAMILSEFLAVVAQLPEMEL